MTQLQHIAWYNLVIANIYAVAGRDWPFVAFLVIAILCFVASFFERQR